MGIRATIFANYLGAGTIALAPILALPWYLTALGPEQFGLIGFVTMLQALLSVVDAGTSQALVREFASRFHASGRETHDAGPLLFGFERLYWLFAFVTGVVIAALSVPIATRWLNLENLSHATGIYAICAAGALFALQFPGSVYRSLLIGAQAQIPLNAVMVGGAIMRHAGGVAVMHFYPTVPAYLAWQVGVGLLETLVRAWCAWGATGVARSDQQWSTERLRPLWKTVASLTGAAWLGAFTVQLDKLILSKMVGLQEFGYYTIAASLALGVLQLVYPLIQAVMPKAVQLRDDPVGLRKFSVQLMWMFGSLVIAGGLLFAAFGQWLLQFWVRDAQAATVIYPVLSVLLLGSALNALYNVGYINWLVLEKVDRMLKVNAAALLISIVIIPPLVSWLGIVGAAFGWLTINLIGLAASLEWLKRGRADSCGSRQTGKSTGT